MTGVFISYRRDDGRDTAGRLRDHLADTFGGDNVFLDTRSLLPGADFREEIVDRITKSDVVVVLVGPHLLARLAEPDDIVRLEIRMALELGKPLIPVLLDGTRPPDVHELPDDIRQLADRQVARLRPDPDFAADTARLVQALEVAVAGSATAAPSPSPARSPAEARAIVPEGRTSQSLGIGHRSSVFAVAFAAEGRELVSIDTTGDLAVHDAATGRVRATRRTEPRGAPFLALYPDRRLLVTRRGWNEVVLWDAATLRPRRRPLECHTTLDSVAFASASTLVACDKSKPAVTLVDLESGKTIRTFGSGPGVAFQAIAVSTNGRVLAMAGYTFRSVHLVDPETGKMWSKVTTGVRFRDLIWGTATLALTSDGSTLAVGQGRTISAWDVRTGALLQSFGDSGIRDVRAVALSADGRLLAGGTLDGKVLVWSVETGELVHRCAGNASAVALDPTARRLATAEGNQIHVWDLDGS